MVLEHSLVNSLHGRNYDLFYCSPPVNVICE